METINESPINTKKTGEKVGEIINTLSQEEKRELHQYYKDLHSIIRQSVYISLEEIGSKYESDEKSFYKRRKNEATIISEIEQAIACRTDQQLEMLTKNKQKTPNLFQDKKSILEDFYQKVIIASEVLKKHFSEDDANKICEKIINSLIDTDLYNRSAESQS